MTIVAAGDSFVYGSELADCTSHTPSKSTFFAKLVPDDLYYCVAVPGLGNDGIARQVILACENALTDVSAVLVSWTFPGRYEFRFNYNTGERGGNWHTITPWTTVTDLTEVVDQASHRDDIAYVHKLAATRAKQTGVADFCDMFYRHVGSSEYWEIYTSLKEIVLLQLYLNSKNIPYMFTCADNVLFENQAVESKDIVISSLYNQLDFSKWFMFPEGTAVGDTTTPRGFYQWAIENKYPVGVTHPLEQAHNDAAELIQEKFNELVKKNIQSD